MWEYLKDLCEQNNEACYYFDHCDTTRFAFGRIIAVNEKEIAIRLLSPDGEYDGIIIRDPNDIFRVEVESQYCAKMKKLYGYIGKTILEEQINPERIKESLLSFAYEKRLMIAIELYNSGKEDVVGFVADFNGDEICHIQQVDEYGFDDGSSAIYIDRITQLACDSKDERLRTRLWKATQKENGA